MAHTGSYQGGTATDIGERRQAELERTNLKQQEEEDREAKKSCRARGGKWDHATRTCIGGHPGQDLDRKTFDPQPLDSTQTGKIDPITGREVIDLVPKKDSKLQPPKVEGKEGEIILNAETGEPIGWFNALGQMVLGSKEDIEMMVRKQREKTAIPEGARVFGERIARERGEFQSQQLAGQIGQFGQMGVSQTAFDWGEAATTGVISSIPSGLRLAAQAGIGAAIGGKIGAVAAPATGGISIAAGAAIGGAVGLLAGIVGGMTSNLRSQRTDNTTAQQRVLDEGKQTLQDWVTLAASDPANRIFYLAQYNKQLALINQAHRQMKLDTSRDLAKFETALPNLAEFDTFYSIGGERDALNEDMRLALLTASPENYNMLELAYRRGQQ